MRILVTGACGFVGSTLLRAWREAGGDRRFLGADSLVRPGSERNRIALRKIGVELVHADLRAASDLDALPDVDVVVDAAAQPSVLAGVGGGVSPRQLLEHNLLGTVNLLEYCRRSSAALVLLSTSRVYSIPPLASLPVRVVNGAFEPDPAGDLPAELCSEGVGEEFSTTPPVSLYGATKLASEQLALEYGATFGFPVFVNRCGVMAGEGQFGRPDQGIYSFWINAWLRGFPLRYVGFGGAGHQVRDCLHPADLVPLVERQLAGDRCGPRVFNVSGGRESAISLRQLSDWCAERMGPRAVGVDLRPRPFDIPWMVLDARRAATAWSWAPTIARESILEGILAHARANPDWLEVSGVSDTPS